MTSKITTLDINQFLSQKVFENPSESSFTELLKYLRDQVENVKEPTQLNSEQKTFLSKKNAKTLFKILIRYVDDQDENFKLIPIAKIALKLFYFLTVYDEQFQDIIEAQDYKVMQQMCLEKHILEGDEEHSLLTAKLVYFISSNIARLKQWKRYVNTSGHQKMQEFFDQLSEDETLLLQGRRLSMDSRLPPLSTYYDVPEDTICEVFKTNPKVGLSESEVKRRQEKYGKNELPKPKKTSIFLIFLRQFADFMVLILIITSIVTAAIQDFKASVVLALVVVFNVLIGFIQEVKAERALASLSTLNVEKGISIFFNVLQNSM